MRILPPSLNTQTVLAPPEPSRNNLLCLLSSACTQMPSSFRHHAKISSSVAPDLLKMSMTERMGIPTVAKA